MSQSFPPQWDEQRVRRVLDHYEGQSEEDAAAEDEAAYDDVTQTFMQVPVDMVPVIRDLITKHAS